MSEKSPEPNPEAEALKRESSGSSLTAYALIKYSAWVVIVLAILYFIANFILPMFGQGGGGGGGGEEGAALLTNLLG